jgi:integrase
VQRQAALAATSSKGTRPDARKTARIDLAREAAAVRAVRRGIRRELGTAQREAAPLLTSELRRVIAALPATLHGARDRALLLLGWAGGVRRSALVSRDVVDLLFSPDEGIAVTLRRDKTD